MNYSVLCLRSLFLSVFVALLLFCVSPVYAVDGKKWDGKAYPFKLLDPSKPNSESNPFVINTAGKLAYLYTLAKIPDMVSFGAKNGLNGLRYMYKDNFVKLTADLDMSGELYEFVAIPDTWLNFDGGGHVIANLRISDKKTEPFIDDEEGIAEIRLALFQGVETVKNLSVSGSTITYNREFYPYKNTKRILTVYAAAIAVEPNVMDGCSSNATITVKGGGEALVGGLATECKYTMSNSHFSGNIIVEGNILDVKSKNRQSIARPGNLQVGGVCAEAGGAYAPTLQHGGIFGCYNTGIISVKVSGNEIQIGGIVATVGSRCECVDIYNSGKLNVLGTGNIKNACIGGVVGTGNTSNSPLSKPRKYIDSGKIYNSGSLNVVVKSGAKISVGGIGGGELNDRAGFESSSYTFGGVYGYINTYNTGSITVSSTEKVDALNVGGIAGFGRMVINSFNTGSISCISEAGTKLNAGGIGGNTVYAQNCYNIGALNVKGVGTNLVGGVIGLANVSWGEDENHKSTVMNVFWLKQQAGGINSTIMYAKGSYYYKSNGGKMEEDFHLGATYSFENPTATVLLRSDDGPGKRKAYEGSLLQALNETAILHSDRNYRKWKIDGSNGGYPVFE